MDARMSGACNDPTATFERSSEVIANPTKTHEPKSSDMVGIQRHARSSRRLELLLAAMIVLAATLLSSVWAIRVPMFLEPDEIAHADASFEYFDAGRPFSIGEARVANVVTRQARYLARATDYRRLRYNSHAVAPVAYGTAHYFANLDRGAPGPSGTIPPRGATIPYALALYPSPYYYIIGLAMRAGWMAFGHSLSAAFFAGRLLNVGMFSLTLILAYIVLCSMRLTLASRLMLFASVAFFPMSTWIGAYVQPDNQTTLLLTASFACALALRKNPNSLPLLVAFGASECGLGLTKLHYALVAIAAFAIALRGLYARMRPRSRVRALTIGLVLPLIATLGGHYASPIGALGLPPSGMAYARMDVGETIYAALSSMFGSVADATFGGDIFQSFWFHYGIRSGAAFSGDARHAVTTLLVILTSLTIVAWNSNQIRLFRRLRVVASRRGLARAIAFVGNDPATNLYLLLSGLLFSVYAFTGGYLTLQGRYWYPILIAIVIVSIRAFSGAVSRSRAAVTRTIVCTFWFGYSAIAAPAAVLAMQDDFYQERYVAPTFELGQIEGISVDGRYSTDVTNIRVRRGAELTFKGAALDTSTQLPTADVRFRVDDGALIRARTGLSDRTLAIVFNDELLARGGFRFGVATADLRPGRHSISVIANEARGPHDLPIETITFVVVPRTSN